MMDIGHWTFFKDFDITDWVGFVYKITNKQTERSYFGKKFFFMTTRKKVKNRKNRKIIKKPSNWRNYTGSSKWLNEDIILLGKENFKFEIISLHENRSSLAYKEVKMIVNNDALVYKDKFYNGCMAAIKYHPTPESEKEKEFKIM